MVIPESKEAEKAALGAVLVDGNLSASILLETLEMEDFYSERHRLVFEGIKSLYDKKRPIDVITITECIKSRGKWDEALPKYLFELINSTPSVGSLPYYCEIIKSKSVARKFISLSQRTQEEVFKNKEIEDVLDNFKESIMQIESKKNGKSIESLSFEAFVESVKKRREGKRTGFSELDRWIDFNPSELNIVAARTGHGKTFFLLNLLLNVYEKHQDEPFIFFSYEMDYEQIVGRILGILSKKYGLKEIRKCYREEALHLEILEAQGTLKGFEKNRTLYIVYDPNLTVDELIKHCKRIKDRFGKLGCVFIDYIQKVKVKGNFNTRQLEVAYVSDRLRAASQELEVPIIAAAQIGRSAVKDTKDKRPRLEDLREAGDIEQDATIVLGLYNKLVQERESGEEEDSRDRVELELWILKNRHGVPNRPVAVFLTKRYSVQYNSNYTAPWRFRQSFPTIIDALRQ